VLREVLSGMYPRRCEEKKDGEISEMQDATEVERLADSLGVRFLMTALVRKQT
jgi:hypothetical protein